MSLFNKSLKERGEEALNLEDFLNQIDAANAVRKQRTKAHSVFITDNQHGLANKGN